MKLSVVLVRYMDSSEVVKAYKLSDKKEGIRKYYLDERCMVPLDKDDDEFKEVRFHEQTD